LPYIKNDLQYQMAANNLFNCSKRKKKLRWRRSLLCYNFKQQTILYIKWQRSIISLLFI
jgi:hypothetical protein